MYRPRHLAERRKGKQQGDGLSPMVWTIVFVLWLIVVWGHSLMPGDLSSMESSHFVFLVRPLFALFGNNDEHLMTLVIRKTAHFLEYVVLVGLGNTMAHAWHGNTRKAWAIALAIWIVAPCVDEMIQLFVPDRAGMPTDVLIDMSGGLLGLLISGLLLRRGMSKGA